MEQQSPFTHDVVVIGGCGHVGLPLAIALADSGASVLVYDVAESAVETVNSGTLPFDEPGAADKLTNAVSSGKLRASTDPAIVAISQWLPSPHTHNPNLGAMRRQLRANGYRRRYLGPWALWTDARTRHTARSLGIHLSRRPTREAMLADGESLPPRVPCEIQ